mgnify:CR=1 FL=1
MKTLVLGGVKSGKSRFAEQLVQDWVNQEENDEQGVIYLATAQSFDDEFTRRIERHQAQRPAGWQTIEEPLDIAAVLQHYAGPDHCVLVECLTLWMSNLLADETRLPEQVEQFIDTLVASRAEIILVSNETGLGIMPVNRLARRFGDETGILHQRLANICDRVVVTMAGLPLELKNEARK